MDANWTSSSCQNPSCNRLHLSLWRPSAKRNKVKSWLDFFNSHQSCLQLSKGQLSTSSVDTRCSSVPTGEISDYRWIFSTAPIRTCPSRRLSMFQTSYRRPTINRISKFLHINWGIVLFLHPHIQRVHHFGFSAKPPAAHDQPAAGNRTCVFLTENRTS